MQPDNATAQKPPDLAGQGPEIELRVGMKSDVGPKRKLNEDYAGYRLPDNGQAGDQRQTKGALFVVADGMGGHQAGEVASKEAVVRVIDEYYADAAHPPAESLVRAIRLANRVIHDEAISDPSKSGMGTTLVAAAVLGQCVYVANVGDSRAYLIDAREINQITEDHSWVEEQIQAGLMSREEAAHHPQRNVITRALGSKPTVEVDLFEGLLTEGQALLLCTDGVCGPLHEHQLAHAVRGSESHLADPAEAAAQLVALAGRQSGDDNATVLIVEAVAPPRGGQPDDEGQTVVSPAQDPARSALASLQQRLAQATAAGRSAAARLDLAGSGRELLARPLVLVLAGLMLLFCLAALVALVWGGSPRAAAAPRPAAVYDQRLASWGADKMALYLGYPGFAEMQAAHGGMLDPKAPAAQPLWPAAWDLYLAGQARDWKCTEQACTFALEIDAQTYQVTYPAGDGARPQGGRVLVYGRGKEGSHDLDAALIVRTRRWWAWWQPRRETVYQGQLNDPAWVYSIVDVSPNGLVEPADGDGGQERGSAVLLAGRWEETESPPVFRYRQVFGLQGSRYEPLEGAADDTSLPTATARPTEGLIPKPVATARAVQTRLPGGIQLP
ncbi:MAG: Stp1/IreP family PP2C-type Ser/Thr phosphatase [Anaerolineae bacterium]